VGQAALKLVEKNEEECVPPMAVDKEYKNKLAELKRLKEFGVLMAAVLTMISAFLLWKGKPTTIYTLAVATLFLVPAYLSPTILKPVEKLWLAFGEKMSMVMTTVLLVLTYYLLMTPIGLLLRVMGKDLLDQKLEPEAKSYWKKIEVDGPSTRPYLPY
jgi:hypothetical protein